MSTGRRAVAKARFTARAPQQELTPDQVEAYFDARETPLPSLTEAEDAFLTQHGHLPDAVVTRFEEHGDDARRILVTTIIDSQQRMFETSWSAAEAGQQLGKSHSTLSRWYGAGKVFAFPTPQGRRFPQWQFTSTASGAFAPVPHLAELVAAIPPEASPLSVEALMTTPQPELDGLTPLAALLDGRVDDVLALVRDHWRSTR